MLTAAGTHLRSLGDKSQAWGPSPEDCVEREARTTEKNRDIIPVVPDRDDAWTTVGLRLDGYMD